MTWTKIKAFFKDFYRKMNGCEFCGNPDYYTIICTEAGIRTCDTCTPRPKTQYQTDMEEIKRLLLIAIEEVKRVR